MSEELAKVRIDKWLWAARFFKTRSLAKQAIEGGKIHLDGNRVKASKEINVGLKLLIRQGWDEKEVVVTALSEQRRGAPEASLLYQETTTSIEKREKAAEQRKLVHSLQPSHDGKPDKKQRRQIHRFINLMNDDVGNE
jgi:ribosome-associated heat shock protein Hsp15